jgi:hypothetical protein
MQSQWPRGLRLGSNPTWGMDVFCCECCVLSGRGLVQRSRTDCGASLCDLETSSMRRPWPTGGGGGGGGGGEKKNYLIMSVAYPLQRGLLGDWLRMIHMEGCGKNRCVIRYNCHYVPGRTEGTCNDIHHTRQSVSGMVTIPVLPKYKARFFFFLIFQPH